MSDQKPQLGKRIAWARKRKRLSIKQLSYHLAMHPGLIEAWEAGGEQPSAKLALRLAGILNVSVLWLLTGENPPLADDPAEEADDSIGTDGLAAKIDRLVRIQRQSTLLTDEILSDFSRLQDEIQNLDDEAA